MIPGGFLPVAPRPFEDELLSSWQGRIACRYDLCADGLSERLGVAPHDRPIGFSGRDFAPASAAVSAWARACRLSEGRVRDMALSRRRETGRLVCLGGGEGGRSDPTTRLSRLPGRRRRRRPRPSHSPDLGAGRELPMRPARSISFGNVRALSEPAGIPVSEPRRRRPSGLYSVPKRRARPRRRGRRRVARNSGVFQDAVLRVRGGRWTAFPRRRARRCEPRGCSGPRLARGAEARTPFMARVASDVPRPPLAGAAEDRSEPLATASLGWRMVTLLGVAQLLDLGGARQGLGSAPFTLDQLAEWTGEAAPRPGPVLARAVALGPVRLGGPLRAPEEYRRLAETILSSEEWRNARGGPAARAPANARTAHEPRARLARQHGEGAARAPRVAGASLESEFMRRACTPRIGIHENSRASYFSGLADFGNCETESQFMGLADKSESKIMGLGGAQISSQSRGRARDPRRAMVDAVLGEHCNIKAFRAGRGAGRRRSPGIQGQPSSHPRTRNPSIRGQKGAKIDARRGFPAIQRPRQSGIF